MGELQVNTPRVSIVMSVFNGQPFLEGTIKGILNQTFIDFEFIIIDDGSTDDTWKTLTCYAERDQRIVLHQNQPNQGVVMVARKVRSVSHSPCSSRVCE